MSIYDSMTAVFQPMRNHSAPPVGFVKCVVDWMHDADESLFAPNARNDDVLALAREYCGPWHGTYDGNSPHVPTLVNPHHAYILHRKAAMAHVMLLLAQNESDCDWTCGMDTTNPAECDSETRSAGPWQVSYNSRMHSAELRGFLVANRIDAGFSVGQFEWFMKRPSDAAIEYVVRFLRTTYRANGPLVRHEGDSIWPHWSNLAVAQLIIAIA